MGEQYIIIVLVRTQKLLPPHSFVKQIIKINCFISLMLQFHKHVYEFYSVTSNMLCTSKTSQPGAITYIEFEIEFYQLIQNMHRLTKLRESRLFNVYTSINRNPRGPQ